MKKHDVQQALLNFKYVTWGGLHSGINNAAMMEHGPMNDVFVYSKGWICSVIVVYQGIFINKPRPEQKFTKLRNQTH